MRTTLDIDDALLKRAKRRAAQENTTLTALIEESLAAHLRAADTARTPARAVRLPVFPGRGGLQPGISDPKSHQALLDAIDGTDPCR